MMVFSFFSTADNLLSVNLFTHEPMNFDDLYADSTLMPFEGENVRVCSLAHLEAMKRQAGRAKDLEDLRMLDIIKQSAQNESSPDQ